MHTSPVQAPLDARQVGWFAARQPGVIRFLEERLFSMTGDVFAVALEGAWRLCHAFAARDGLPARRLSRTLLEKAEAAIHIETSGTTMWGETCAHRQPELCEWVRTYCDDPPVPLGVAERRQLGIVLLALIYALDEQTTGRPVP